MERSVAFKLRQNAFHAGLCPEPAAGNSWRSYSAREETPLPYPVFGASHMRLPKNSSDIYAYASKVVTYKIHVWDESPGINKLRN